MKKELSIVIICSILLTVGISAIARVQSTYKNQIKQSVVAEDIPSPTTQILPEESSTPEQSSNPKLTTPITSTTQVFTTQTESTQSSESTTVLVTGDVLLARHVNVLMRQKNDFTWPFQKIAALLTSADITLINLETPLTAACKPRSDGMIFCGDLRAITGLQFAGVDVVNLANNHASNQGYEGVVETSAALKQAGLRVAGLDEQNLTTTTVNGTTFAFLGFNEVNQQAGVASATPENIVREVAAARSQADIVIVQFHWGNEYTYTPTSNQRELARVAIDAGANLIVGNHPHWFQPLEFYKDTLIVYSHGNLVFDQMWSTQTRTGLIGEYTFLNKKLSAVKFTPVLIEEYGQPKILIGTDATEVLERFKQESLQLLP